MFSLNCWRLQTFANCCVYFFLQLWMFIDLGAGWGWFWWNSVRISRMVFRRCSHVFSFPGIKLKIMQRIRNLRGEVWMVRLQDLLLLVAQSWFRIRRGIRVRGRVGPCAKSLGGLTICNNSMMPCFSQVNGSGLFVLSLQSTRKLPEGRVDTSRCRWRLRNRPHLSRRTGQPSCWIYGAPSKNWVSFWGVSFCRLNLKVGIVSIPSQAVK